MSEDALFCLRVRYVETGRLKYLSHLELLRALERTIRRSGVPFAVTQGFHPRIKVAYGPALPVGVASTSEWFDLWVRAYKPAEEYLAQLRGAAPVDLAPQEAAYVDLKSPSLSAALTLATWEVELAPWETAGSQDGPCALDAPRLQAAFDAVLARGGIEYLRSGKPRRVELAGKFAQVPVASPLGRDGCGARVSFTTRSSNEGALRPDVLMGAVIAQLAESSKAAAERWACAADPVVSFKRCMRTDVVRTAQYLEGDDGTWLRPI